MPDRRATLVFGGWQAQTQKAVLLHQLSEAVKAPGIQHEFDQEAFCTGLTRSVTLCNFRWRGTGVWCGAMREHGAYFAKRYIQRDMT